MITIFDKGESIKIAADPRSFAPPDPNMILTVTDSACTDASHLSKDTFVLHDVTYVIDDEYSTKPQICLSPQQIKRIQLQDQSLAMTISKLRKDKVCSTPLLNTYFLNDEGVLYWSVREGVQICEASGTKYVLATGTHHYTSPPRPQWNY